MNRIFGRVPAPNADWANGQEARKGAVARPAARAANERLERVDGVLFTALLRYYIVAYPFAAISLSSRSPLQTYSVHVRVQPQPSEKRSGAQTTQVGDALAKLLLCYCHRFVQVYRASALPVLHIQHPAKPQSTPRGDTLLHAAVALDSRAGRAPPGPLAASASGVRAGLTNQHRPIHFLHTSE